MRLAVAALACVSLVLGGSSVRAHELRPSLLAIEELAPHEYRVELRRSVEGDLSGAMTPTLPAGAERLGPTSRTSDAGRVVESFRVRVPGGWEGKAVALARPDGRTGGEVLVRAQSLSGRVVSGRVVPGQQGWVVPIAPGPLAVAGAYLSLGVEHILGGLDHLAFVLGLVLLTPAWRRLWKSVTAFTVAHSVTLALAALEVVHVPQPPVEAVIALSILFVAREAALAARGGAPPRAPWAVAFAFGLLHGLGFAGALAEVGLPAGELPVALLSFNVGVELGQLAFVVAVLALRRALRPALDQLATPHRDRARLAPAYAIGALAVCWCLQRVVAFWV